MWPERPVSRVLSPAPVARGGMAIIPLGPPLPAASSDLTRELRTGHPQTLPYLALLRMGFTELPTSPPALVSSYLTLSPLPAFAEAMAGGLLSVALSLGSPPVPVRDHPALWSPDFPPPACANGTGERRSPGSLRPRSIIANFQTTGKRCPAIPVRPDRAAGCSGGSSVLPWRHTAG